MNIRVAWSRVFRTAPPAGGVACAAVALFLAPAAPGQTREDLKTTVLVSKSLAGGFPNGPSRNPAISSDGRYSRVVAFESDATDVVAGDTNGRADIFARFRTGAYSNVGEPWVEGEMRLISRGLGGQPSNGRSYLPALSGTHNVPPRCIAFVSAASNLVAGDTNRRPDAFLYDLRTQAITRLSVGSYGQQSNGTTFDVAVDTRCDRAAFTSNATNLALTEVDGLPDRQRRAWRGTITTASARTKQVFVRILGARRGLDKALRGLTFLLSASDDGRAGQGETYDPVFPTGRDDLVAFTSTAPLLPADQNGVSDVYARKLVRVLSRRKKGAQRTVASLRPATELISARADGLAGNGPSSGPKVNGRGDFVFYQTDANDLLPGDANQVTDVVRANRRQLPPVQEWVSMSADQQGNGVSTNVCPSTGATNAVFESDASNFLVESLRAGGIDSNGVRDIFIWTVNRRIAILESRSSEGKLVDRPSSTCAMSARANYILFESTASQADTALGPVDPGSWAANQIYMRYLGPETVS